MCQKSGGDCCQQQFHVRQYRPTCSQTGWAAQVGQIRGCVCSHVNSSPRGIMSYCPDSDRTCLRDDAWNSMVDINPGHLKWMQLTSAVGGGGETQDEDTGCSGSCSTDVDNNDAHGNCGNDDKELVDDVINGVEAAEDIVCECVRPNGSENLLLSDIQKNSESYEPGSACDRAFTQWLEQIKMTGLQVSVDGCKNVSVQDYRY